jgi:hypothetical protein
LRWWFCILCCILTMQLSIFFHQFRRDLAACLMFWGWSLDSVQGLHFGSDFREKSLEKKKTEKSEYNIMYFLF